MDAHAGSLDDLGWYEWDGPNRRYLGMWLGQVDGLEAFRNLVESLCAVFRSEEPDVEGLDIDFCTSEWCDWLPLLHDWAFRFQMPLLRSDMFLWQAEDESLDDFYEFAQQWQTNGDLPYPKHPLVWKLVDGVFTSSVSAIQAMLGPEGVISTNNPWELEDSPSQRSESCDSIQNASPKHSCHCLIFEDNGWNVHFADTPHPRYFHRDSGLSRIAMLIENAPRKLDPQALYQSGARRFRSTGRLPKSDAIEGMSQTTALDVAQDVDDPEGRQVVERCLNDLHEERMEAVDKNDQATIDRIDSQLEVIHDHFNVQGDAVLPQRAFPKKQAPNRYKAVKKTINEAIEAISSVRKDVADELSEQIDMEGGFRFTPKPDCTKWRVSRR